MVITSDQVRIIDQNCEEMGISTLQLMENAGSAVADVVLENYPDMRNITICCGVGNNGGDGFVAARHLAAKGKKLTVLLIGQESKIKSQIANHNYQILKELAFSIKILEISDTSKINLLKKELEQTDLIIDALLGVGIKGEPYDPIKSAIKSINSAGKTVVSVDVPSGINSDELTKAKIMVNADIIITLHDTKPCLTSEELAMKTVIKSIGVPPEAELFVGKGELIAAIPKRKHATHKGQNGRVLIIGGSSKYSGAPVLSSRAALRTGADLVITCIPQSIAESVRSDSPNMIARAFPGDYLTKEDIPEILELFEKFDALVIGPGLSENLDTKSFVLELLKKCPSNKPIIIDADALKAIKGHLQILNKKSLILTPHHGEFTNLFDIRLPDGWKEQIPIVEKQAKEYSIILIVKGEFDIISNGKLTKVNRTGHPGMTVGGTGDVLAGITGEIASINKNLFLASCAATYLSGKAGEYAATDFGSSLLATDVIEKIPEVLLDNDIQ